MSDAREYVRERYGAAARSVLESAVPAQDPCGCDCGPGSCECGPSSYDPAEAAKLPRRALDASLGCGNPLVVAQLQAGETVLDLGSGAGLDVLLSARRVGPEGKAYGLDMTDEMLALASEHQRQSGVPNAEFLKGHIESIPLPAASVDVVISNCVINLSTDKASVFSEIFRVLRPGGRVAVTDIVADEELDDNRRADFEGWAACIAGALTRDRYRKGLEGAGLTEVTLEDSHPVAPGFTSMAIRAKKPGKAA
jgi:arsenite methyltransferase